MKYTIQRNVLVITPTVVNEKTFEQCYRSVMDQTYEDVHHLFVIDGPDHTSKFNHKSLEIGFTQKHHTMFLPWNVGKDGGSWYGHRVYASVPKLIPEKFDYVMFLDEDNWFEPDHVQTCVELMEANPNLHFCHSLRGVYSADGEYLLDDNCESLGRFPVYVDPNEENFLVDTSSYCFRRDFIRATCPVWDHGWGGDRRYFHAVKKQAQFGGTGKHTLCYRLDGNANSVNLEFFEKGNEIMRQKYGDTFPWEK